MKKLSMVVLVLLVSCKKEKLENSDSAYDLKGHWRHYTSQTNYKYLSIDDGSGQIAEYSNGVKSVISDGKEWYIKENVLLYSRFSNSQEKFHIDSFPKEASVDFVVNFDSVYTGENYMWLDGLLFH